MEDGVEGARLRTERLVRKLTWSFRGDVSMK